jgi:FkbM family methyltransferase
MNNNKVIILILIIFCSIIYNFILNNSTCKKISEATINHLLLPKENWGTYKNYDKLVNIQNKLKIKYGSFYLELAEQLMSVSYLTGNEKVLEIGGNIGRNSLIISYILNQKNNNNLVTLEMDPDVANKLIENKELNDLDFFIEISALSTKKMIKKDSNLLDYMTGNLDGSAILSDVVLDGYSSINTITFNQLQQKYNIIFDTLVLDCEGAFYYILLDMPEILNNIKLILVENDYDNPDHKTYIDDVLIDNNFNLIYTQGGGWGTYANNFYEVWKK